MSPTSSSHPTSGPALSPDLLPSGDHLHFVSVAPTRIADPALALPLLRSQGAVILTGVDPTPEGGVTAAKAILGSAAIDVRPQISASKALNEERLRRCDELDEDDLRRTRYRFDHTVALPPHNDGFAFGDEAPDFLFLNCIEPCPEGGESWLLDGLALVGALADAREAIGLWDHDLDHTDPGYQLVVGPIAQMLSSGRVRVRMNPYQRSSNGEQASETLAALWDSAKTEAARLATRFKLDRGELLCVDNLRMAHSRDPYVSDSRLVVSTWAWTPEAVALPADSLELI